MTSGDERLWTLSDDEEAKDHQLDSAVNLDATKSKEQHESLEEVKVARTINVQDLVSVTNTNRPSINKMLPTRYSELELDSHRLSSNRQNNLLLSPPEWSSSYMKGRVL